MQLRWNLDAGQMQLRHNFDELRNNLDATQMELIWNVYGTHMN